MDTVEGLALEGFHGNLHGVSLIDLLQMYHLGRRTLSLLLTGGAIHFKGGEVIHAEAPGLEGEAAFQHLLMLTGGEIEAEELKPTPVSIQRSFQAILIDTLVRIDEHETAAESSVRRRAGLGADATVGRSTDFDRICGLFIDGVQDALCCAIVSLGAQDQVMGLATTPQVDSDMESSVTLATAALFRCSGVVSVDQTLSKAIGVKDRDEEPSSFHDRGSTQTHCEEVHLVRGPFLYLGRTLDQDKAALLVVTQRSCSIGLGLAQMNAILKRLGSWRTSFASGLRTSRL